MRLKVVVCYDGTLFSGYQVQPNARTVQGEIERVLKKMHKGESIRIHASGRTDQGVHAMGQVFHFDSVLKIPPKNWERALNTMLPDDIQVQSVQRVSDDFHARFDVEEKEYRYMLYHQQTLNVFQRNYACFVLETLNIEEMRKACRYLIGTHDFSSFCAANSTVKGDKVRTIIEASIECENNKIQFSIKGTGFLYNMVRIIVGTLIEIGKGNRQPYDMQTIMQAKDRTYADKTAPSQGLYLWEVIYEKNE
ncbi:tRNA pseudouridine(38-40) synthase TruA [Gracilibacillus sp. YIM 98692]|uniref:tRNA pseudouridine(38-40) synthase TruA n=1 Tax=Gracilibacillus sp. YIM 98692 TaxID=2663532 RepID=UPI0013CF9FB1|nr:tRNA pseudouridine(38-40) synthase TruA [Gracilibacillus sp. YIM 98692]